LFNYHEKEHLKTTLIEISEEIMILDLLKNSIKLFNSLLQQENYPLFLNTNLINLSNYGLKPSKKNGKPKDLPSKFFFIN
jgi:hypothetical protein